MNQQDSIRVQAQKDPAQIEQEISQQRRHIDDIVRALENKLSPGEVFESVLAFGKGGGKEFAGNLGETIKNNPVTALLTAAGMAWLYSSSRQPSSATTISVTEVHAAGFATADMGGTSPGLRERASDKLGSVKSTVGEKAHGAADAVKSGAHRASDGFSHLLETNPLAVGAIGIAVGALVGSLLPTTRKEHELLGETSDRVIGRAKELARQGMGHASAALQDVTRVPQEGSGATTPAQSPGLAAGSGSFEAQGPQRAH